MKDCRKGEAMKKRNWIMTAAMAACLFTLAGGQAHAIALENTDTIVGETQSDEAYETIMDTELFSESSEVDMLQELEAFTEQEETDSVMTEEGFPGEISQEDAGDVTAFEDGAKYLSEAAIQDGDEESKDSAGSEEDPTKEDSYENKAVYDFIVRMYEKVLNREPEENGIRYWYDNIIDGKKTGADVAAEFFGSKEYQEKKVSADTYLEDLYRTMLNRGGDQGGKAYWMGILDTGVSRDYLMKGFIDSNEYGKRCADSGIEAGIYVLTQARDQNINITKYITHFYQTTLGRGGDEKGLNYWAEGLLTQRFNGAAILNGFMFSNEYVNKQKSESFYVDDLYTAAFSRAADVTGKAYWMAAFEDGVSRHYTAAGFNDSNEYKKLLARYGIMEGPYKWLEARDEKRPVTAYVNQMIFEGTGSKADADTLNTDLRSLYDGKTSAIDLVTKYMSADGFDNLNNTAFVNKACQLIFGRDAKTDEMIEGSTLIAYDGRSAMIRQLAANAEFSDFCKKHDILMVGTKDNVAMQYAKAQMDLLDWNIRDAFAWIVNSFTYLKMDAYTGSGHTQYYGCFGFENKKGNCYVMAADFYWMAKAKGINIDYYEGLVPGSRVPLTPHGWCEATINGVRYIFDPDFEYETGRNGYMFVYKTPGTWKYTDGVIMNDR